jgi:osmotically-inducible protein OsmY
MLEHAFRRIRNLVLVVVACLYNSACAPVLVGTAVTGASVAHDSRSAGTQLDDELIEDKGNVKIAADSALEGKIHINITSYNQIVLMTGEAETEALRERAIQHVRTLPKVRRIYNEITVAEPTSMNARATDTWITTKVKSSLVRIKDLSADDVKVVTENRVVFLMGLLNEREGSAAAAMASRVSGVKKVVKLFEYPMQPAPASAPADAAQPQPIAE